MTKLATRGAGSKGWAVDATSGAITWSAKADLKFSVGVGSADDLYAEDCPHHNFAHGTAKAEFI